MKTFFVTRVVSLAGSSVYDSVLKGFTIPKIAETSEIVSSSLLSAGRSRAQDQEEFVMHSFLDYNQASWKVHYINHLK